MSATQHIIEVKALSASYGENSVLNTVSFTAERGSITAVLGANGSGKSTLLRLVAGLEYPNLKSSGSICVNAKEIANLSRKQIAQTIAYTPQSESILWAYTVQETVLTGRFSHSKWAYTSEDKRIAHEKIALMDLESLADRSVTELSGGEFQRTLIARALAQESPVLLFDEPVSSLDIRHQYRLMQLVRYIVTEQNLCAIISLHDINLAALFADKILFLKNGSVFAHGKPDDTLQKEILKSVYGIDFGLYSHPQKNVPQVYVE